FESKSGSGFDQAPECSRQADVLSYYDSGTAGADSADIEAHLATCDDCREVLVVLAESAHAVDQRSLTQEQVTEQVELIKGYIDAGQKRARVETDQPQPKRRSWFFLGYPQLAAAALVILAIGAGAVLMFNGNKAAKEPGKLIARALAEDGRRTQGWLSEMEYAPYTSTRGVEASEDPRYAVALSRLEDSHNEAELDKVRIATGKPDQVTR